jgi:hypothetical protein
MWRLQKCLVILYLYCKQDIFLCIISQKVDRLGEKRLSLVFLSRFFCLSPPFLLSLLASNSASPSRCLAFSSVFPPDLTELLNRSEFRPAFLRRFFLSTRPLFWGLGVFCFFLFWVLSLVFFCFLLVCFSLISFVFSFLCVFACFSFCCIFLPYYFLCFFRLYSLVFLQIYRSPPRLFRQPPSTARPFLAPKLRQASNAPLHCTVYREHAIGILFSCILFFCL